MTCVPSVLSLSSNNLKRTLQSTMLSRTAECVRHGAVAVAESQRSSLPQSPGPPWTRFVQPRRPGMTSGSHGGERGRFAVGAGPILYSDEACRVKGQSEVESQNARLPTVVLATATPSTSKMRSLGSAGSNDGASGSPQATPSGCIVHRPVSILRLARHHVTVASCGGRMRKRSAAQLHTIAVLCQTSTTTPRPANWYCYDIAHAGRCPPVHLALTNGAELTAIPGGKSGRQHEPLQISPHFTIPLAYSYLKPSLRRHRDATDHTPGQLLLQAISLLSDCAILPFQMVSRGLDDF